MDLTFQVPMQYCSLQHRISPLSLDTPTTEHRSCFGPAPSFFLELLAVLLHSSPAAHRTPPDPGAHLLVSSLFVLLYSSWVSHGKCTGGSAIPCSSGQRPGMLQPMGLQRAGHDWATEQLQQQQAELKSNSCAVAVLWPFTLVYLKELKKK